MSHTYESLQKELAKIGLVPNIKPETREFIQNSLDEMERVSDDPEAPLSENDSIIFEIIVILRETLEERGPDGAQTIVDSIKDARIDRELQT